MSQTTPLLFLLPLLLAACSPEAETANQQETAGGCADTSLADTTALSTTADTSKLEYQDGAIVLSWEMLSDVTFEDEFSEEVQAYVPYPTFGKQLRAIEGREVMIEGYIIPLEETGDETILVLSAQPYSSCFFCGGAGPESVMDIKLKPGKRPRFTTDDRVTFRGKLRLNDDDLYYLNYILEEAEVVDR